MTDRETRDAEELYIYSAADFERILGDGFVDVREVVADDETAAQVVDILYRRLTDDFYATQALEE